MSARGFQFEWRLFLCVLWVSACSSSADTAASASTTDAGVNVDSGSGATDAEPNGDPGREHRDTESPEDSDDSADTSRAETVDNGEPDNGSADVSAGDAIPDVDGDQNDTGVDQDGAADQWAPYPFGLSDQTMEFGGVVRRFRVHVPDELERPVAVVLVLHGGGGEGMDVAELGEHPLSVFRTVADREGFVVVYPEGSPANEPMARVGWADCRADNRTASGADDVGFLAALVERIRNEYLLTSAEMFVTGGSNGAQMTHAFAFRYADRVGAVATGSGSLPETPLSGACTTGPERPLPILILHGTGDTQMPYEGGCVANLGGACNRGRVISAEATRDRWLELNGLSDVSPVQTVIDTDVADAGAANRWYYAGSAPLEWWRLDGAGHAQPSLTVRNAPNPLTGIQSGDIEFAEVVWEFFSSTLR